MDRIGVCFLIHISCIQYIRIPSQYFVYMIFWGLRCHNQHQSRCWSSVRYQIHWLENSGGMDLKGSMMPQLTIHLAFLRDSTFSLMVLVFIINLHLSRQCKDVFPFSTLSLRPCCSVDDPRRYICKDTLLRFINLDVDAPLLAVIVVVLLSDACCCMLLAVDCNYNY
ncbi:hypothetical protein RND81_10G155200 [Saponaria officinalis]|uniref:Uncharacterized protein n=1 Tax=Saponaria officinalis TaxID=3572 RepID=A0AAW1I4W7_SAPOF